MKVLTLTEKQLIQNMMRSTLERAFSKPIVQELYNTYGEAVFREVEYSEWYQKGEDILAENIDSIIATLINDAGKFMLEGEFDNDY